MAEFPALPLWTDAYLADTRHLSQAQHGAYLMLLMTAWRTPDCSLPDDDSSLARYAGCSDMRNWARQKPIIMAFWQLQDGRWRQKRLTAERQFVADKSAERAASGRRGAEAKWRPAAQSGDVSNITHTGKKHTRVYGKKLPPPPPNALGNKEVAMAKPFFLDGKPMAPTPIKKEVRKKETLGSRDPKAADAAPAPSIRKQVYDLGRPIIGAPQTTDLIKAHADDLLKTLSTLKLAKAAGDPKEYCAKIIRREVEPETDWDVVYRDMRLL